MKDDFEPKKFGHLYAIATHAERSRLISSYRDWIFAGAKAQGIWSGGIIILGISAYTLVLGVADGSRSPLLIGACVAGVVIGAFVFGIAARREREWRCANPWRGPGEYH